LQIYYRKTPLDSILLRSQANEYWFELGICTIHTCDRW